MRKLRLAATAAAAMAAGGAAALVLTSAGVSSAAPVDQASPASPVHATLTAATTVEVASFSCPTSPVMYAIACQTGLAADMLQQEMAFQSQELNQGALVNGFGVATFNDGLIDTWVLYASVTQ